ncbi:MAG: amidohydrolase family protein [Pyrinomonadaceae bacterium]
MRFTTQTFNFAARCLFAFVVCSFVCAVPASAQGVAVRGETIHTMNGAAIQDGVVLIRDGKIERVGAASQIQIPANYRVINARVVTPGLIDAHSTVGLSGYLNQPHDQMQLERSASMQPELRAIDAYNGRDRLVEWVRGFGVTTLHTGHGPGTLISGQTMIVKTIGGEVEPATIVPVAMIAASFGDQGLAPNNRAPGTYSKELALLRTELLKAQEYARKQGSAKEDQRPARDLHTEALARVIKGELPLLVSVHHAHNIIAVLRLAKEFNIRVVLDGAAEAYLVVDQIKAANVPVIIHPTMARAAGESENLSMETAATLRKAGISVALQSGFEAYVPKTRVVLFEAAAAAANGLSFDEALATITINAARVLGIANRVGSLEIGKDADLAMYDGDPFEYTTHCTGVLINGQVVSAEAH